MRKLVGPNALALARPCYARVWSLGQKVSDCLLVHLWYEACTDLEFTGVWRLIGTMTTIDHGLQLMRTSRTWWLNSLVRAICSLSICKRWVFISVFTGAKPIEVTTMNTLTGNIHSLLASFYQPTVERSKIIIEKKAFPSDYVGLLKSTFCYYLYHDDWNRLWERVVCCRVADQITQPWPQELSDHHRSSRWRRYA